MTDEYAFPVEKNMERKLSGSGKPKYPWKIMEIGDSFFVPNAPIQRVAAAACSAVQTQIALHGKRFSCETIKGEDNKPTGVRVFRTE